MLLIEMFYMRRLLVHLTMIFYIIFENIRNIVHPIESFNGFGSFMTHFQKNGERVPINNIGFRFNGVHRLSISRI